MLSGKSIGRKDNVCGHIGVMSIEGISGCTREPPADNYGTHGLLESTAFIEH
jgi:hypothetical protein